MRALLRCREDQEVVHLVALHKVVLPGQAVASFFGLTNQDVFVQPVVLAISVAIDNSDLGAGTKRGAQVFQQGDRVGDLVIRLQN
jgi:hypothetical protein